MGMQFRNSICSITLLAIGSVAGADIVVDASGDGDYLTIQEAIDAASQGDVIQVRAGTYTGSGEFIAVCEDKLLSIIGAGVGKTILDGEGERAGLQFVSMNSGDVTSVLEGVTVQNCVQQDGTGGGVRVSGPMIIRDCSFEHNGSSSKNGGAVSAGNATLIESCVFQHNVALSAGALYARNATIRDCVFEYNQAVYNGGAIWSRDFASHPMVVENCTFRFNTAGDDGGAVRVCCGASMQMTGCELSYNSCGRRGGGVYIQGDASLECAISETVIDHCQAADSGGAVHTGLEMSFDEVDISFCQAPIGGALCVYVNFTDISSTLSSARVWDCASDSGGVVHVEYDADADPGFTVSNSVFCANTESDITGVWSDGGGNDWTGDDCPWQCNADLNGDSVVNVDDVLLVIARYGTSGSDPSGDGIFDVNDILVVIDQWGPCERD